MKLKVKGTVEATNYDRLKTGLSVYTICVKVEEGKKEKDSQTFPIRFYGEKADEIHKKVFKDDYVTCDCWLSMKRKEHSIFSGFLTLYPYRVYKNNELILGSSNNNENNSNATEQMSEEDSYTDTDLPYDI